jgi:diguanylate cyclase (GGDEF)-like protein
MKRERLDENQRKKSLFNVFALLFHSLSIVAFIVIYYMASRNSFYEEIDNKLLTAARASVLALGEKFFDRATARDSVSRDEDLKNVHALSELSRTLDVAYVYSMVLSEGDIYFTASSATSEELGNGSFSKYFDRYIDATEVNKNIFIKNVPVYEESKDQWGYFRSVLIPLRTSKGTAYIAGADYNMGSLNGRLLEKLLQSVLIGLFFMLITGPIFYFNYHFVKKENELLKTSAYYDELTRLPNLKKMTGDMPNYTHPVLFILNINSLKQVNNLFGFDAGDELLKEVAKQIRFILVSEKYKVYKMLNDEYGVIIDDGELTRENVVIIARYLFDAVSDHVYAIKNAQINITVYIGVVISKLTDTPLMHNLFAYADMALKIAKQKELEFVIYENSMNKSGEFKNDLDWSVKLREAIKKDSYVPYFQPIVNNLNGKIEKYECLIRLIENGKVVSPISFIAIAKKIKLYSRLTRIMFKKSFDVFKDTNYEFSINIASYDIYDNETCEAIISILEEFKSTISRNLVIEILESEGIENYEIVRKFIMEVKRYGCRIAIDDFGSGYSNFEHILKLSVDYIKIDGSLIRNIDVNENDYVITRSITDFAKALGIKTIAEYVHSESVYRKVLALGIDFSQGYYFGPPSPTIHT